MKGGLIIREGKPKGKGKGEEESISASSTLIAKLISECEETKAVSEEQLRLAKESHRRYGGEKAYGEIEDPLEISRDCLMTLVQSLVERKTNLADVVRRVRSDDTQSELVAALKAVLPTSTSRMSDRGSSRFARSLGLSVELLQKHAKAVPDLMQAFLRVYKLEQTGIGCTIPEHLLIDEAALPPLPSDLQERPAWEQDLLKDYEVRRRALEGEEVAPNAFPLFCGNGRLAHECYNQALIPEQATLPRVAPSGPGMVASSSSSSASGFLQAYRVPGGECLVHSFEAFQKNMCHFEQGLLWGLDLGPDRLVVGGSATMACALPVLQPHTTRILAKRVGYPLAAHICDFIAEIPPWLDAETGAFAGADLDLFIIAQDLDEAKKRFFEVGERVYRNMCGASRKLAPHARRRGRRKDQSHVLMARTGNTVTICGQYPLRHVQLVAYVTKSITEVLSFVDLDCTAMVYDGRNVWANHRALRAHSTGYNIVPRSWLLYTDPAGCAHLPTRVQKYAARGFGTLFCGCGFHSPNCSSISPEFNLMLRAMEAAQNASPELWKFLKEAVSYRLTSHLASNGGAPMPRGSRDFYDMHALFPGIPRSRAHSPASVRSMLERDARLVARSSLDRDREQPQPLDSLGDLRDCANEVLTWRVVKAKATLLNPMKCF